MRNEAVKNIRLMDRVHKVVGKETGQIEIYAVPMELINNLDVPVDEGHVEDIASSMKSESQIKGAGTGQLSPILLGGNAGWNQFEIIDGFHREAALRKIGADVIYATIRPDCTRETVIDLRITTAQTHKTVEFARIVEWAEEAWSLTPWADKIAAKQAFWLGMSGSSGKRMNLSPEVLDEIATWIKIKTEAWRTTAGRVFNNLSTARLADPTLIKKARERKGGSKLEAITPQHLQTLVRVLPNNFHIQKVVADYAVTNKLTAERTRYAALTVVRAKTPEEAQRILESEGWKTYEPVYTSYVSAPEVIPIDDTDKKALQKRFFEDEMEIAKLTIELAVTTGRHNPPILATDNNNDEAVERGENSKRVTGTLDLERAVPRAFTWTTDEEHSAALHLLGAKTKIAMELHRKFNYIDIDMLDDIASEAILGIVKAAHEGTLRDDFKNPEALYRLLRKEFNLRIIDCVRKQHGVRGKNRGKVHLVKLPETDREEELLGAAQNEFGEFEEADKIKVQLEDVKSVLYKLGTEARRALVLRLWFNLSDRTIAEIMGKDEDTIGTTLVQVKNRIRQLLNLE